MIELRHGDCLEQMRYLADNSVDMVLADLPYGTTECGWDSVIPFAPMWSEIERVTKDDAAILLFAAAPFDKVLACSNLDLFRYEWIWEKPAATGFFNANKMPLKAHENILVFYKKLPTYNPQKTQGHERKVASKRSQKSECYGKNFVVSDYDSTERYPRSVLKFPRDKQDEKTIHPTQKPVALCEYLIRTYSNKDDMVLDFCMGSGTTGVAARNLQRRFFGIEKKVEYFDLSEDRIVNSSYQLYLLD